MNNNSINEKIAEMIESARKKPGIGFELSRDYSLSSLDPSGDYFKQKRFELAKQIEHESMFGWSWARHECSPDILKTDWIYKCTKFDLDDADKKEVVWSQLERFLDQFLLWLHYDYIVRENESQELDNSSRKEYASLTRSRAFCIIEILKHPEHNETKFSKKKIIELVKKMFPDQSGKTVYDERGIITNNIEEARNRHKLDYEYGLKLYKEKYPD